MAVGEKLPEWSKVLYANPANPTDREPILAVALDNGWNIRRPFTNLTIYTRENDEIRIAWRKDDTARFVGKNLKRGDWAFSLGAMSAALAEEWFTTPRRQMIQTNFGAIARKAIESGKRKALEAKKVDAE